MNKNELLNFIYMIVHDWHNEWSVENSYCFNNEIIDLLRNQLADDVVEWKAIHIDKKKNITPDSQRNIRNINSNITFRKFKFGFEPKPCEICGIDRALNICHIIPRSDGGPDDDWNLLFLCANHHYLFDNHKLTKEEWDKIIWANKGTESQHYINNVVLQLQEFFWNNQT